MQSSLHHRSVLSNTGLNLAGTAAPLLAALVGLPLLNRWFGPERLGFLTLAWALIGYLSLFDLGIGRALTKVVAERLGDRDERALHRLVWTGLALMLGLGVVAALALAAGAGWLARSALSIRAELDAESAVGLRILAVGVPFAVMTAGLRGILEAQGRFLLSNAVRAPLGAWLFLSPLLLVPFGVRHLGWVVGLLVLGRILAWLAYAWACVRSLPGLLADSGIAAPEAGALLRAGGWMTVSNVVGPLMVYVDRFVLGSQLTLEAVAWYATPFEVVTKVLVIPSAAAGVLFPLFSAMWATRAGEAAALHRTSTRYMALALFPPTFLVALFAGEGLSAWLGPRFAEHAEGAVQWIAVGCLANAVAHVPFALLQGSGRPDIAARIHLLELPLYLALVIGLTSAFGIAGAAAAWALRMAADLVVLELFARARMPRARGGASGALWLVAAALALFGATALDLPLAARALLAAAVLAAEAALVWNVLLERDGLGHLKGRVRDALRLPSP